MKFPVGEINGRLPVIILGVGVLAIAACSNPRERDAIDPAAARYGIAALLPEHVKDRPGWAEDIHTAFDALGIRPTAQNICAVVAITQQESTFTVHPVVPGLSGMARKEIETRAVNYGVPRLVVRSALLLPSPNGQSYSARLDQVKTEKELSDLFDEFIGRVPLGGRLFGGFNPVRTGGPMQVSIAYAQAHARDHSYPYRDAGSVRDEVFTRRGGMYYGIAHLLDYPVSYDRMLYRFADFNAGHYASRNAAFQNAVKLLSGAKLALDGDLLMAGNDRSKVSQTEQAVRNVRGLDLGDAEIRDDLERSREFAFEKTRTYERVFALADARGAATVPRAMVPRIRLESIKITRNLTTDWFANRVDQRYRACLSRGTAPRPQSS